MRLVAPWHVEYSQTRDRTQVPCFGRWALHCWTIREDHFCSFPRLNSLLINGSLQSMPKLLCISHLIQRKIFLNSICPPITTHFFHSLPMFSNLIILQPIHSLWASNLTTLLKLLLPRTCMFSMLPNPAVSFLFLSFDVSVIVNQGHCCILLKICFPWFCDCTLQIFLLLL